MKMLSCLSRHNMKIKLKLLLASCFSFIAASSSAETLTINGGGYLKINGEATLNGKVQANASSELFPEQNLACVTVSELNLANGSTFNFSIDELYVDQVQCQHYNQIVSNGDVSIENATLSINLLPDVLLYPFGSPTDRYTRTLIVNNSANPVNGYFNGIREGEGVLVNNDFYVHLSYKGGDGNDVIIWRGDDDNDGVDNRTDQFDDDPNEWFDSDGDGTGDNADQMPNDATETLDSDGDGVGDNADAFDDNPLETVDTDGDGIGDNRDAFPNDPNEHTDSDNDGIGDNAETDKDNDGLEDGVDNCPLVANNDQTDTDGDTVGDACDIDNDADGLIDISNVAQLFNIRFNLNGTAYSDGYFETSASCGDGVTITTCSGYELINDIDFDENGDGLNNDSFNQNSGWIPVGNSANKFNTVFEGNDNNIKNMVINNSNIGNNVGFFGYIGRIEIRNLHFNGELTEVNANASSVGGVIGSSESLSTIRNVSYRGTVSTSDNHNYLGGLIGYAQWVAIEDSHADVTLNGGAKYIGGITGLSEGSVVRRNYAEVDITTGGDYVGGLVGLRKHNTTYLNYTTGTINSTGNFVGGLMGYADLSAVISSYSSVNVTGYDAVGGLIGFKVNANTNLDSYSIGVVTGYSNVGGLIGEQQGADAEYNYWDTETSGQSVSALGDGYTTSELQTPTSNTGIYENWSATYWDFGEDNMYPALVFNGIVHRDWDGDGIFDTLDPDDDNDGVEDNSDAFPYDPTESIDTDSDGIGNNADNDDDNDGVLDIYDQFPEDNAEQYDSDGDGLGDNADPDADNDTILDVADNCPIHFGLDQTDSDGDSHGDICDVDNDADGLIDISTPEELNNVRYNLAGTSYSLGYREFNESCGDGVTVTQCNGYELTNDIDFDENGDGIRNDSYNQGEGWSPIGDNNNPFTTKFEGNDFNILNLTIDNSSLTNYVGLFGYVSGANISDLHFNGELTSVKAEANSIGGAIGYAVSGSVISNLSYRGTVSAGNYENIGGLIGYAESVTISDSFTQVEVTGGNRFIGGLTGYLYRVNLSRSFSTGSVNSDGDYVGGLSSSYRDSTVRDSYSSASVAGNTYVGGITTFSVSSNVHNNYAYGAVSGNGTVAGLIPYNMSATTQDSVWDIEATGQSNGNVGTGYTSSQLKAPTSNTDMYINWDTSIWNFGTSDQYPALIFDGFVRRDSDGDFVFDADDAFPSDPNEWNDTDGDGIGDNSDAFPNDANETLDSDGDGVGDNSDTFPNDSSETEDTDGDSIGNNADTDDDNDGIEDADDLYPLVECLSNLTVTNNLASGTDSLQRRILEICENGTITFDNDYTIELSSALVIPRNVTIDGSGFNIRINANGMLDDSNADLVLRGAVLNLNDGD